MKDSKLLKLFLPGFDPSKVIFFLGTNLVSKSSIVSDRMHSVRLCLRAKCHARLPCRTIVSQQFELKPEWEERLKAPIFQKIRKWFMLRTDFNLSL